MQTSINPALAAAMTLEQAAQVGEFQPMTREGQPTVAAQLMQRAVPPSVPDVVQQAGLGGQIQNMQLQEAQKELMNRMVQQSRPPAGIEALNPQMGNFARGGIVGYAEGEFLDEQAVVESEPPWGEEVSELPEQPRQPTVPVSSRDMYESSRRRLESISTKPVDPAKGIEAALARRRAFDEYRKSQGLPPEMEQLSKQEEEFKNLMSQREQLIAQRMQEIARQKERESLSQFMMNFRYGRGQPFSQGILNAVQGLGRYESGMVAQQQKLQDLQQQVQMFSYEKRAALANMRDNIARGDFNGAMQSQQAAIQADNKLKEALSRVDLAEANAISAKERSQKIAPSTKEERVLERYNELLKTNPKEAEDYLKNYKIIQSSARTSAAKSTVPRVHKVITDPSGNVYAVMSDGSPPRPLGMKSSDFNNRLAKIILDLRKKDIEFQDMTPEEQRAKATEILLGKEPSASAPAEAKPSVAKPAPLGTRENPIKLD